jgi:hypothetical protein
MRFRSGLTQKPSTTSRTLCQATNKGRSIRDHPMLLLGIRLRDNCVFSPNGGPVRLVRQQGVRYQAALFNQRLSEVKTAITSRHAVLSANDQDHRPGATDVQPRTKTLPLGSAHPVCSGICFLSQKPSRMAIHEVSLQGEIDRDDQRQGQNKDAARRLLVSSVIKRLHGQRT